jgi:organic hydroperoxide reductase OsmC/OhrA
MTAPPSSIRTYEVRAQTTRTFGRVIANARDHYLVVDGPVQNGCPGEEITPAELFLGAVASCGAELISVIARETDTALTDVDVTLTGTVDRSRQPRPDVTVFSAVQLDIVLSGTDGASAAALVEGFKRR